jgi:hypothetical protein
MKSNVLRKNHRLDVAKLQRVRKSLGTREAALAKALKKLLDRGRGHVTDPSSGRSF